jgi:RNA ligase (TIGR02306 family)
MRKLASIQEITALSPIDGADAIEVARILGWNVVVKKGDFKVGDLCVYCEIDSILPVRPEFEFLRKHHTDTAFRLRTIKLRGQVSQGLALPLSVLPDDFSLIGTKESLVDHEVTDILGIIKYEPYIPACLAGKIKGNFPSWIPKTDETRVQNLQGVLDANKGTEVYETEKLDGSSMTVYLRRINEGGDFGVCSRNLDLEETEGNSFWRAARMFKIEEALRGYGRNLALQGELIGPGIQGNKYKLKEIEYRVFNVFDIDTEQYLSFRELAAVVKDLGLQMVPVIDVFKLNHSIDELVKKAIGFSTLNPTTRREGSVYRTTIETNVHRLGRFSFKGINPEFLLKYGDE